MLKPIVCSLSVSVVMVANVLSTPKHCIKTVVIVHSVTRLLHFQWILAHLQHWKFTKFDNAIMLKSRYGESFNFAISGRTDCAHPSIKSLFKKSRLVFKQLILYQWTFVHIFATLAKLKKYLANFWGLA